MDNVSLGSFETRYHQLFIRQISHVIGKSVPMTFNDFKRRRSGRAALAFEQNRSVMRAIAFPRGTFTHIACDGFTVCEIDYYSRVLLNL